MSEKVSEMSQSSQRRQQQYYHQQNQQRNYNNGRHYQQHSYQQEQQQQQRRYSNQRKIKDEEASSIKEMSKAASVDYTKQVSTASSIDSFSNASMNCVLCLHSLTTRVTYCCMHYICLHCAVKMRIICEKIECPICRQTSENVICSKDTLSTNESELFTDILKGYQIKIPLKGGFNYDFDRIQHEYEELLSHRCKLCKGGVRFDSFNELDQHLKRTHQMFYCDLCTNNLKLFTFERKFYSRQLLAQHRREGDTDDQSFKGHPNCSYCDERFFDRDELYRHLRKDHFYCHFCDADGHEEYYESYLELRKHFKTSHYLCEIDDCGLKGEAADAREYAVFRSEIDFNAHKKLKHAKTKSEAKNFGKINVEFNFSNPIRDRIRDRGVRGGNQQQEASSTIIDENSHGSSSGGRSVEDTEYKRRERNKQMVKQQQNLREMYEKFEASLPVPAPVPVSAPIVEEVKAPVSVTPTTSTITSEESVTLPSTWRDLISSGPVPKMNLDAEFPSLSNEKKFSSLASLGESIASSSAWAVKKPKEKTKQTEENKKATKVTKVQQQQNPKLTEIDNNLVDLKQYLLKPEPRNTSGETFEVINKKIEDEDEKNKKEKKVKNKKNKSEIKNEINEMLSDFKTSENFAQPLQQQKISAPPGFSIDEIIKQPVIPNKNPPPGFSQAISALPKVETFNYTKPKNYDKRNNDLTLEVISLLDGAQFNIFKTLSADYHTEKLNAKVYLERCKGLFLNDSNKHKKFLELLQEMIILLPDIRLQNHLYDEYISLIGQQQQKNEAKLAWAEKQKPQGNTSNKQLLNCINCNQLLDSNEISWHMKLAHGTGDSKKEDSTANDEFPDLPSSSSIIFNNPQEALSLLNKKKSRNKKFMKL